MAGHSSDPAANLRIRNASGVDTGRPASQNFEQYSQYSLHSESSQSSQTTQGSQGRRLRKSGTGGGAWNAPVAHLMMTETSGQTYGFGTKTEEDRYCRLAEEARRWVLGPMPPRDFLDEFLNQDDGWACRGEMPASQGAFDAVPKATRLEKSIYEPLARAMNQGRCPGFTFCVTSEAADNSGPLGLTGSCKPDLCCYASEHLDRVKNYEPKPKRKNDDEDKPQDGDPRGEGESSDEAGEADSESESEGSSDAGTVRRNTSPTTSKSNADSTSRSEPVPMKHTHMGYAALVIEVKAMLSHDVFHDPNPLKDNRATFHFVTDSTNAKVVKRLGQQVAYASEMCKRQHRDFCFSISICSHYARFIRWDRAGAIVSERFSVREHPELLCDFLWRFAWASHAQRGYDLTVEPATIEQATEFEIAIQAHVRRQGGPTAKPKLAGAVKEHFERESVTVIHLPNSTCPNLEPDEPAQAEHYLLVSRPIVIPLSVAGRGTRTYWAVDPHTKDVCLLKDTWRYDAPKGPGSSGRKGDVLHALHAVTENVPPIVRHGDVLRSIVVVDDLSEEEVDPLMIQHTDGDVQTTLTQNFLEHSWVCRAGRTLDQLKRFIIKRTHHRLVLGAAGYPLLRFKDSNELLHATYDAFGALKAAFEQGKRLHRDITPGNIILCNDPARGIDRKGYLIDWELSRECEFKDSESFIGDESCPVSATWQFVSAAIAKYVGADNASRQRHTIGDDIESIIYVVLYCALLWLPLKEPDPWVVKNVLNMFDYWTPWQDGVARGAGLKDINLEDQSYTGSLQWTVPSIQEWLSRALRRVARDATRAPTSRRRTIGKAFHAWWGSFLEANCQDQKPAKRSDNTTVKVLRNLFTSTKSAAVMEGVVHQSTISASGQSSNRTVRKRMRGDGGGVPSESSGNVNVHGSSSKRPRLGWGDAVAGGGHLLPTSELWRAPRNESIDTVQAISSWNSSRASSVLRDSELMETEGDLEGDPDHPDAYESDAISEAEKESADVEEEQEDASRSEIETSTASRVRGVRGSGL